METAAMLEESETRMLVALRVRERDAATCAEALTEIGQRVSEAEGFLGLDVIRRDGGLGVDFLVVLRFRDADSLANWTASDQRRALLDRIESLAIADISRQQAAGSSIWFAPIQSLPGTPPAPLFWKRWATSMLAVYPALVALVWAFRPLTERVHWVAGLFIVAAVLTGLTTAFIVPWLTRVLRPWLLRT
ncbi:MAG: hypothetical protein CML02_16505 [Pseudooceanicola sp.]|jgi:antibiotic biosynthesis monooxygenase (ABM) superfamily enzyme|nr:hypothetical protein [Pseudooceanicola sp.]